MGTSPICKTTPRSQCVLCSLKSGHRGVFQLHRLQMSTAKNISSLQFIVALQGFQPALHAGHALRAQHDNVLQGQQTQARLRAGCGLAICGHLWVLCWYAGGCISFR